MSIYSISDLEQLSGIKAHTLRIWEQRYDLLQPKRTPTNIRYYDDSDLKLVLNVSLLKDHGFKISAIARMSEDALHREVLALAEKEFGYADQIQSLTLALIDMDEDRFEKVIATSILRFGFEHAMIQIVYPFLQKIGLLWQVGAICPAQEHFMSNLIRQKLIVAIDGQMIRTGSGNHTYLLFLPEGELHEISLLFANYLLRSRQQKVVYLGQSVPFDDLRSVYTTHQPDFILTIITSVPGLEEVQEYIRKLSAAFPETTVLVSGFQVVARQLSLPGNVLVFGQVTDLTAFLHTNHR